MKAIATVSLMACGAIATAQEPTAPAQEAASQRGWLPEKFVDPEDGKFDMSAFLATAYGFVPVGSIITDPAVGYGGAVGLIFIDPQEKTSDGQYAAPNLAAAAAFGTENGSWGGAGGHSGHWRDDRLKTLAGAFYTSLNLEFFGDGDFDVNGEPLEYNLLAWGSIAEADWKIEDSNTWVGLRYVYADVTAEFDLGNVIPGLAPLESEQRHSGLTPILRYDSRDNIFTPKNGLFAEATVALFREGLGGDSDFELTTLTGIWYHRLGEELTFGVNGDFSASSGDVPFYLRPYVQLRGIQSLRLQGENRAQAEVELRWQRWGRYSLVVFAGGGSVWQGLDEFDNERSAATGGIGFRYLVARLFGLHMGFDLGFGPDDPIIYLQFGSAWFRP